MGKTPVGSSRHRALAVAAVVLAGMLQLVVLVPFTLASGLVAPLWAVLALVGVWIGFLVVLIRTVRRQPLLAPLVPVANAAVLWLALIAGDLLLGWTA